MSVQRASLAEDIGLAPVAGKEYKLFLVEVDDEDRERVLSARVGRCEITVEPEYSDVYTDFSNYPMTRYRTREDVTVTLNLVPSENGTYFEIVDFTETAESDDFTQESDEDE